MYERIPLTQLRALEALVRNGNTARAAAELNVTPGAIARQMRSLEDLLGIPLFERMSDGLYPNAQAFDLARETGTLLAGLKERLAQRPGRRLLRLGLPRNFAALVLAPRLGDFLALRPDLDLVLDGEAQGLFPSSGHIDLLLRYGLPERAARHDCEVLDQAEIFPVASPALAQALAEDASLMSRLPRLDFQQTPDWALWLSQASDMDAEAGPQSLSPSPSYRLCAPSDPLRRFTGQVVQFSETGMIYAAARQGVGIAIGHSLLARKDLASGTLVKIGRSVPERHAYCLIRHQETDEAVAALADFIRMICAP